jgi:hypothetical protein
MCCVERLLGNKMMSFLGNMVKDYIQALGWRENGVG